MIGPNAYLPSVIRSPRRFRHLAAAMNFASEVGEKWNLPAGSKDYIVGTPSADG